LPIGSDRFAADICVNLFLEFAVDGTRTVRKHISARHPMRRLYRPVCARVIRESGLCNSWDQPSQGLQLLLSAASSANSVIEQRSIIKQRMRTCESG
jgi:hypothetical protein